MYYLSRQAAAMRPVREVILPQGVYELDAGSVFLDADAIRKFDPLCTYSSACIEIQKVCHGEG